MKKVLLICSLVVLFLSSCNRTETPEQVVQKFMTAINAEKYEEAKKYCDTTTAELVGMLASLSKMPNRDEKSKEKLDFKITRTENITDDKVKVYYMEEGNEKSIDVKKIDGKWKIAIDKENSNKEGNMNNNMEEQQNDSSEEGNLLEEETTEDENSTM